MSPAGIVAVLRQAQELLRLLDTPTSVMVSNQPESLVLEVARAAGVTADTLYYPVGRSVIISARIEGSWCYCSFSSQCRPATAEEIAAEAPSPTAAFHAAVARGEEPKP